MPTIARCPVSRHQARKNSSSIHSYLPIVADTHHQSTATCGGPAWASSLRERGCMGTCEIASYETARGYIHARRPACESPHSANMTIFQQNPDLTFILNHGTRSNVPNQRKEAAMSVTHSEPTHSIGDINENGCGCCHGADVNGGTTMSATCEPSEFHEACGTKDDEAKGKRTPSGQCGNQSTVRTAEGGQGVPEIHHAEGRLPARNRLSGGA